MNDTDLVLRFAVAIAIGVLLGLERERTKGEVGGAGVRTFALIALSGALSAYLDARLGISWMAPAMFVGLAALVIGMYVMTSMRGDTGITTEVSALMAFLLGLLCDPSSESGAQACALRYAAVCALADGREAESTLAQLDAGAAWTEARAELEIATRVAAAWQIPGLHDALDAAARRYAAGESALGAYVQERDLALSALEHAVEAQWRLQRARLALWELAGACPVENAR